MEFLDAYHRENIREIMLAEGKDAYYPLLIECANLYDTNPHLGGMLYEQPAKRLQNFDDAALQLQDKMCGGLERQANIFFKENVHVRVCVLGSALDCPEAHPSTGKIRVEHVGQLLTVDGTVIRSGGIKALDGERTYECTTCKHRFEMSMDLGVCTSIRLPSVCPSKGSATACDGAKFKEPEVRRRVHDYQEIKIQENARVLGARSSLRSIAVVLDDDLVDTVQAGDDIVVTGVFRV